MASIESQLEQLLARETLPASLSAVFLRIYGPLADRVATDAAGLAKPYVVGVCGAQGSGKSTGAEVLRMLLQARGLNAAVVSLDDLYLTHDDRDDLTRRVHPLLRTRGVPGTHDIALGMRLFDALSREGSTALPRFDKSRDDRRAASEWPTVRTPVDVIVFEGWCVGARPQATSALDNAINELERERDTDGVWRRYANHALETHYAAFFARIDLLLLLRAPSFDIVFDWRREQEMKLRERIGASIEGETRLMNDAALRTFIAHYERLTRHILEEMPARADIILELDTLRRPIRVRGLEINL